MNKAYIVLLHKDPEQAYKLLQRLDDNKAMFFVHIDIKKKKSDFKQLYQFGEKVQFIKRENGKWGGFGIVQATINGLEAIKKSGKNFDQIHLISGQDYPIKSNQFIDEFFRNSQKKIFMKTLGALPLKEWWLGGLVRINEYYFGMKDYQIFLSRIPRFLSRYFSFLRKKIPYDLTIYGGSQWWTIDMYAMNFILEYVETHPKIISFFRFSKLPDEMFFQTILLNSGDQNILNSIENDSKRYIVIPGGQNHPIVWTKKDLNTLLSSDALYSRKFDPKVDSEIFDLLDHTCK